jgi:hypothetical protein
MTSYKHTRRRHGVFRKKRNVTKRFKKTLRKSRRRVMKGGMKIRIKYKNGAIYEGDIKDGKENGYGTTKWPDGSVYVGKFKNGLWHGQGKMRRANGEVYEGRFMNGFRHGKGKATRPNGEFYEGDYRHGLKHGIGTYQWADGSVYVGEWIDDNITGRGKWRDENGVVYEGNMSEGGINSLSLLLQDGNVSNLAFHPTEPLLLAVCRGKTHKEPQTLFLQRFNRNTGHIIDMIPIPPSIESELDFVISIAFHPTEPIFAVGNDEDDVDLFSWEINDDSVVGLSFHKIMSAIKTPCEKIAFHPHEPLFATYGEDPNYYSTRIWRIERAIADDAAFPFQLTVVGREFRSRTALSCIAFHPTQPIIITSSDTRLVYRSDKRNENNVILWKYNNTTPAIPMVILSNLETFASDSNYKSYHTDDVNFVAFHPTKHFFATASKDATVKMWRMTPKPDDSLYATCVATFRSDDNACPVTCVAFHPTEPLLVGGFYNGNAVLWEYIGVLSKKVLSLEPDMYESRVVAVFPLPPPMHHRLRITPAMLTEATDKLHRRTDREQRSVSMMKKSPRVPFFTPGVEEDPDSSPSPPPVKSLTRAELNRRERELAEEREKMQRELEIHRERQRLLEANIRVFVSAVNFQVDSRGVSFLEIGRNNTNVVELRNVSVFTSEVGIKNRDQITLLEFRKKLVDQTIGDLMASQAHPRAGTLRYTGEEIKSAMSRLPVRLRGKGFTVLPDPNWDGMRKGGPPRPNLEQLDIVERAAIDSEEDARKAESKAESEDWQERVNEAKRRQDEKERLELSQPLPSQPQPSQPLPSQAQPSQPLPQPPKGGNSRRTRRKNRRNQ